MLVAVLVAVGSGCAKVSYVTGSAMQAVEDVKSGEWKTKNIKEQSTEDKVLIEELTPGTYGGVEFNNLDDVMNYYKAAYDKTKAKTAPYIDENGTTQSGTPSRARRKLLYRIFSLTVSQTQLSTSLFRSFLTRFTSRVLQDFSLR